MSTSILTLEVRGASGLTQVLKDLTTAMDAEQILDQSGAIFLSRIRARYLEKVSPEGVPWEPSQAGLRREAAGGPGTGYDTGNLWQSIQLHSRGSGVRAISTDVPYAPFFQFGYTRVGKGGVSSVQPPREFLGFSEDDKDVAERFIIKRIERLVKK